MNTQISLIEKYPPQQFNLLGNTDVIVEIPEIMSPVVQAIKLNPDPNAGDVYVQQKAKNEYTDSRGKHHPATPDLYAITKNGLKKLADGAGIKMLSSEHVIPNTCQKCVAVNAGRGQVVQCGNCSNRDIAYHVTISVPQLTGEILSVEDTHEIIVDTATVGMTDNQRKEFMKHLPQICEAKALNGAIRTALHLKGTYTREELMKPFVVAYLVPNLNHNDIKQAAIDNMFASQSRLFGKPKPLEVSQIESRIPDVGLIEAADGEEYDQYVDGTYTQDPAQTQQYAPPAPQTPYYQEPQPYYQPPQPQQYAPPAPQNSFAQQPAMHQCADCGALIEEKVYNYSNNRFGRPLCYSCQRPLKGGR